MHNHMLDRAKRSYSDLSQRRKLRRTTCKAQSLPKQLQCNNSCLNTETSFGPDYSGNVITYDVCDGDQSNPDALLIL